MHTSLAFLSFISFLPFTLTAPTNGPLSSRQLPSRPCSHLTGGVHVIASGGDGVQNTGQYGLIGSLATSILNAIPGSTNVSLPYNKVTTDGQQLAHINQGAQILHQYIADYRNSCPNTKIVLLGYYSGAIITMNTLCGATPPFSTPPGPLGSGGNPYLTTKIIATVLYGDETRTPYLSYDLGNNSGGCNGKQPRQNANRCITGSNAYQSYCDVGDVQCCVNSQEVANAHFAYPKYDQQATQFVRQRLAATGGA